MTETNVQTMLFVAQDWKDIAAIVSNVERTHDATTVSVMVIKKKDKLVCTYTYLIYKEKSRL